jgi:LPXTG-motif cell wall-anchored protein
MELLKQAQGVMYAEQPMIVIDYPSVLQAVNVERWEGWQPYVGGSVWNNFLDRQSYIELKPKVAEAAATGDDGGSSLIGWVGVVIAAFAGAFVLVWLKRRRAERTEEE